MGGGGKDGAPLNSTFGVPVKVWMSLNMCYNWAGYEEMGAKYVLPVSLFPLEMANDFNITLLVSTFLNPLI